MADSFTKHSPAPSSLYRLLTGLGELRNRRDTATARAAWSLQCPSPSRATAQTREWSQLRSHPSPPSSPEPWPCDRPTQHQRAFLALRGILSLPASTQPSLPARCSAQPEGCGTSGLNSLGGSPWPWDGEGCLSVPPCPMGAHSSVGLEEGLVMEGMITRGVL